MIVRGFESPSPLLEKTQSTNYMQNTNSKIFRFKDKGDFVFYLSELIVDLIQKTDRLKFYHSEIEEILRNNPNAKFINAILYDSISDKVNRVYQYLFNLLGDESKMAVSYRKFRKLLYKQRNMLEITISPLTEDELQILSEFNSLRNWSLHIPESLYIQKRIHFQMDSNFMMANKNKIAIPRYDNFEIEFLTKQKEEIESVFEYTDIILKRMKEDYSSLIDGQFELEYEENQVKPYFFMKAVEESWNSQNRKG